MFTLIKSNQSRFSVFHLNDTPEFKSGGEKPISEERKAYIMTVVENALTNDKDLQHEALKVAMKSGLDQYLNDPKIVLEMLNYAQEKGKSALVVLAISKRFATLIQDPVYYTELAQIEEKYLQDKSKPVSMEDSGTNAVKETVRRKILDRHIEIENNLDILKRKIIPNISKDWKQEA